jgi:RNA polymerase sigma-70 factor (ECF subfamily)
MVAAVNKKTDFVALYNRFLTPVYKYLACRLGRSNQKEAEDLTQEVFIKALKGLAHFDGKSEAAWLFTIAKHVLVDYWRKKKEVYSETLINTASQPFDEKAIDDKDQVARILVQLPEKEKELIELKYLAGFDNEEISQMLGCTKSALAVRVHRALAHFKLLINSDDSKNISFKPKYAIQEP